jgi:hypothetical protein
LWQTLTFMKRVFHFTLYGMLMIAVVLLSRTVAAQEHVWSLKAGQEFDSNPLRVVGAGSGTDTATRMLGVWSFRHPLGSAGISQWGVTVGGRVLLDTGSESAVVSQFRHSETFRVHPRWTVGWGVDAKDRTERDGFRDYRRGGLALDVTRAIGVVDLSVHGSWQAFEFKPAPSLSWHGPQGAIAFDVYATDWLTLQGRQSVGGRFVGEEALRASDDGLVADANVFRQDLLVSSSVRLSFASPLASLDVGGNLVWNDSNASGRSYRRQVFDAQLTVNPVGNLFARVAGQLQRTTFPDTALVDDSFALDDENRNQFSVSVENPVGHESVTVELRSTWWADAFSGDETDRYMRWVGYAGVAWRGRTRRQATGE